MDSGRGRGLGPGRGRGLGPGRGRGLEGDQRFLAVEGGSFDLARHPPMFVPDTSMQGYLTGLARGVYPGPDAQIEASESTGRSRSKRKRC